MQGRQGFGVLLTCDETDDLLRLLQSSGNTLGESPREKHLCGPFGSTKGGNVLPRGLLLVSWQLWGVLGGRWLFGKHLGGSLQGVGRDYAASSVVAPRACKKDVRDTDIEILDCDSLICREVKLINPHVTENYENSTATTVDLLCSAMFQPWD